MSSHPSPATQQVVTLAQAQKFWLQWVEAAFPDLDSRTYFLPPVYFIRVPMTRQTVAGQDVLVLGTAPGQAGQSNQQVMASSAAAQAPSPQPPRVQDSDVRDDAAMQRLLFCLQKMSEQNKEVFVVHNQLKFEQCLGEPCYSAVAAQLPVADSLPSSFPENWKQGDFDVLLLHRYYGFVVCEVKAFGDNIHELNMSQQNIDNNIRKKLRDAVSQLDKAEAMLSHLVSDIAPGLRITKTIAFPNLTARQLQQAISGDTQMSQALCRCLGTSDPADIAGLCLCCDQLSDPKTPWDVSSHVLRELGHWWQRRVAGAGRDGHMTFDLYKTLVARFCGPATTVSVPCTCPPRVSVKTLGQAVWWTGECYTAVITLFPEQINLLNIPYPHVYATGPPGTGKTVVLLLKGIEWLRCGHHVYVVSTEICSRPANRMIYNLLLCEQNKLLAEGKTSGQPHFLQYDFNFTETDVDRAVRDLSQAARGRPLYIIADEAADMQSRLPLFCGKLLIQVPRCNIWLASSLHQHVPSGFWRAPLTRPLRSPPAVVREVQKDEIITKHRAVHDYSHRGVPDHTDGPPVKRLCHRGQGHATDSQVDCVTCGRDVASFLHSLRDGDGATSSVVTSTSASATPPRLQWKDMLLLSWVDVGENSGIVTGLREADIPVRIIKNDDEDTEDLATARSDVVWVSHGGLVRGLERKVVVCLEQDPRAKPNLVCTRYFAMSRATAQLVIVSPEPLDDETQGKL